MKSDDIPKAGEPAPSVDLNKPMPATRGDSGRHLEDDSRVFRKGAYRPLAEDTVTDAEGLPVDRFLPR